MSAPLACAQLHGATTSDTHPFLFFFFFFLSLTYPYLHPKRCGGGQNMGMSATGLCAHACVFTHGLVV